VLLRAITQNGRYKTLPEVLTGKEAKRTLGRLLTVDDGRLIPSYPKPYISGYYWDIDLWVAFDNSQGRCWIEQFETEDEAKDWLDLAIR